MNIQPIRVPDKAKSDYVGVLLKLSPEEAEALDRTRGEDLRAPWIKQLVRGAVQARERLGRSTDVWVINEDEAQRLWKTPTPESERSPAAT